jgi:hypothetical protein
MRRRALPRSGGNGASAAPGDLRTSLESTRLGLARLLESLESSGFREAIGPYDDMRLVLLQQRLWTRANDRADLDALWEEIAATARAVHEILSGFAAVMAELADLDRTEPDPPRARQSDEESAELGRLLAVETAVSGRMLQERLPWPPEVRRRVLADLVAAGILERRGWGRSLSYRLGERGRAHVSSQFTALAVQARQAQPR